MDNGREKGKKFFQREMWIIVAANQSLPIWVWPALYSQKPEDQLSGSRISASKFTSWQEGNLKANQSAVVTYTL